MKQILLNTHKSNKDNYKKFIAIVDDEDFDFLSQYKWFVRTGKGKGYACSHFKDKEVMMHRVIMKLEKFDGKLVDHVDGNPLNNQRSNLRIATKSQNNVNRKCWKNKKGGIKSLGVFIDSRVSVNKYKASIMVEGTLKYLGLFEDENSAAKAYNEAAKKYYGEFARLNLTV